jgi:hypothetical protein
MREFGHVSRPSWKATHLRQIPEAYLSIQVTVAPTVNHARCLPEEHRHGTSREPVMTMPLP